MKKVFLSLALCFAVCTTTTVMAQDNTKKSCDKAKTECTSKKDDKSCCSSKKSDNKTSDCTKKSDSSCCSKKEASADNTKSSGKK